jgi:hypothetical protein
LPWSDRVKEIDAKNVAGALEFNRDGHLLAAGGGCARLSFGIYVPTKLSAASIMGTEEACRRYVEGTPRWSGLAFSPSNDILATAGPDATLVCGRQMDAS